MASKPNFRMVNGPTVNADMLLECLDSELTCFVYQFGSHASRIAEMLGASRVPGPPN